MIKYFQIFKISLQQEFAYRFNFVMWRVRNVLQIFLVFFLWDVIFRDPSRVVFGYDRAKIMTYVFGILVVKTIVTATRAVDIPGEIADGKLSIYLLKPINYFKYWFTRDVASKVLNMSFAIVEIGLLVYLLKPEIFLQTSGIQLLLFLVSVVLAILLYFHMVLLVSLIPLWHPEQGWGSMFLMFMFTDFLGGGIFPIDILPITIQRILFSTPFPYMIFSPIQIYLGKVNVLSSLYQLLIALVWVLLMHFILRFGWRAGLKSYRSEGI